MKLFGSLLMVSLGVGIASANPVFVNNASFETLASGGLTTTCTVSLGCSYSYGVIPGWTLNTTPGQIAGLLDPGTSSGNLTYFNYVPNGTTVAYTNGGMISQTVGATVQAGLTYTLSVDVGLRNDSFPGTPVVSLLIGTSPAGTLYTASTVTRPMGGWAVFTVSYAALASDVGKPITIQLSSATAQGDFDNVQLISSLPEPGTGVLAILGFAAALPVIRARRQKRA